MLIPYSWLKDFVNLKKSAEDIAEVLSATTIGVSGIKKEGGEQVLDLDVTYNRGDLLSVIGVARELAAIFGLELKGIEREFQTPQGDLLKIKSNKELAKIYTLTKVSGLSYEETPDLVKRRLEAAGMRSVNLWADLTNYVMLEYGQPFHAFDVEKVSRRDSSLSIEVRKAKNGEAIRTLDGLDHRLTSGDIVIADRRGPIAVAGVMGSEDTEVDEGTKEVLLEAAIFDPVLIRRTARRLGLRSEASTRFEHFLSYQNIYISLNKLIHLFERYGKGRVVSFSQIGDKEVPPSPVVLTHEKLTLAAGEPIPLVRARGYLARLGFKLMSSERGLLCWPPYFRGDIKIPEDIVEEVLRIQGYEQIPPLPIQTVISGSLGNEQQFWSQSATSFLSALGFHEIKSYPFASVQTLSHLKKEELLRLRNPISSEAEYLRPNLLFSLLEVAAKNASREKKGRIFELEKVYPRRREVLHLGGLSWGEKDSYLGLKSVVEMLVRKAHFPLEVIRSKDAYLHPQAAGEIKAGRETIGFLGILHPHLADAFGLPETAVFEIDFEKFSGLAKRWGKIMPVSSYPEVYEEFSFLLPESRELGKLLAQLESASEIIREVNLVDRFKKEGERSLTVKVTFQSSDTNLSDRDIKPIREKITSLIRKNGGTLRS